MTWEIIVIVLIFVFTNVGQSYFTTWRVTSTDYLNGLFQKDNPLNRIQQKTSESVERIFNSQDLLIALDKKLDTITNQMEVNSKIASGGYEQLYALIMRGSSIKIDELIEDRFKKKLEAMEKREAETLELGKKIEEYGRVILKK